MKQRQLNLKEMSKICLIGAGGHGKVVRDIAENSNISVEVFIDDNPKSKFIGDVPVVVSNELSKYESNKFIISIGNNHIRKIISKKLEVSFISLIDDSASISSEVIIEEGSIVMPKVVVNSGTKIGKHCIINSAAVVEHDYVIDDFVHVSPNATLTGGVEVGEGTHIGAAVVVIPNITIGKWVTIGAGAVIINDVPDYAVVVGNPGKIINYNKK